jgi:hypothetical protein
MRARRGSSRLEPPPSPQAGPPIHHRKPNTAVHHFRMDKVAL